MEYACGLAGLVLVTANPSFQVSELKYALEQSGAVGLFMVDGFRGNPMAEIAQEATSGNTHLREVVKLEDEHALYVFGERPANLPDVQPDDAAQIQYTSGTTGFPSGAVLSHKNLVNNARTKAEALAHSIARFPQSCMRADRRSVRAQHGLSMREALRQEWLGSKGEVTIGIEGAARFASGKGRGGDFSDV